MTTRQTLINELQDQMKKMIVNYVDKTLKTFPEVDRLEDERH